MKMLQCSSSPDKNAVLMSPDTGFQLDDATHWNIKACAESGRLSGGTSVRSGS